MMYRERVSRNQSQRALYGKRRDRMDRILGKDAGAGLLHGALNRQPGVADEVFANNASSF